MSRTLECIWFEKSCNFQVMDTGVLRNSQILLRLSSGKNTHFIPQNLCFLSFCWVHNSSFIAFKHVYWINICIIDIVIRVFMQPPGRCKKVNGICSTEWLKHCDFFGPRFRFQIGCKDGGRVIVQPQIEFPDRMK